MMKIILKLLLNILLGFKKTSDLVLENNALRQQLAIMKQTTKRPQIHNRDGLDWVLLSRIWSNWRDALVVVKPDTVVRWLILKKLLISIQAALFVLALRNKFRR